MSTVSTPRPPPAPRASAPGPGVPRLRAGVAAGVAVGAVAAALAAGQLVAGLVSPPSAPYQAVADAVVRWAPPALVEFGKTLALPGLPAGRADKVGLLVGIGLVLVGGAAATGLACRRSAAPGRRVVVALGAVALAAVVSSPVFTVLDLVAPLAALATGLWVFGRLHGLALAAAGQGRPDGPGRPGGPDRPGGPVVARRRLLVSSLAVGVGTAGAGAGGTLLGAGAGPADLAAVPPGTARRLRPTGPPLPRGADFAADGTPSFLTANADFYRIDTALRLPVTAAADWSMRVHGMVERELTVSYADLLARPRVERTVTLTCVSNEVGGDLISTADFVGVSLRELLLEAGVHPDASQLLSTSRDGFTAGTPTEVVLEPDRGAMLVLGMNGEPLPLEHGYPVRMVVPGLYGYVSATKWLAELELTTFEAAQAFWRQRGWAERGPIKTQSRIDVPRSGAVVPAGRVVAAGIAWAQHRGIAGVEVRVDDGPWLPATLSTEVSRDTWRMWRIELTVAAGSHTLTCRATDTTGQPQTPVVTPTIPDGASGWPGISLAAR